MFLWKSNKMKMFRNLKFQVNHGTKANPQKRLNELAFHHFKAKENLNGARWA